MAKSTNNVLYKKTSILIAHPYPLVREGLCRIISEAGFLVCEQVGNINDLFKAASENNPDLIIVDFRIMKSNADLVDKLRSKIHGIVTIVSVPEVIAEAPEVIKAGAKGYLSYSQTSEEFIQSLSLLAKGSVIVSNVASEQVQSSIHKEKFDIGPITERERDVVILVAKGATNREIADKLMVSQHTIKIHLHSILNKLNLRNRQQIAAYAIQQGLVKDIQTEDFTRPE
jgi:DNA-binding NarL/FixJ family response regulator